MGVTLNGTRKRMSVGDVVEAQTDGQSCQVFFKQALVREDGRVGFDLTCS